MTGLEIIAAAKARRIKAGLELAFIIPDRPDVFTCYPHDEATKNQWIENGKRKGWVLVS